MKTNKKQINIFFAIPCGEFFSILNQCIKKVCKVAGINPIIIEDHLATKDLWQKIIERIDYSDYFIADISSKSPNILLELGYSIREKKQKNNVIFIADNIEVPVDLQGLVLQKYSNIRDFQKKLIDWIAENIPFIDYEKLNSLETKSIDFYEDFKDYDRFLKLWTFPPQSSFKLTHEGLQFTNAHFPIMTAHLALLKNYEFEFKAKIITGSLGWIIKGTRQSNDYFPTFCVMFNININGELGPHIFNINKIILDPPTNYKVFDVKKVNLKISKEGWFTIITKVNGDNFTISNNKNIIFQDNFDKDPYKEFYDFPNKQGEIGFRCAFDEQGIINYLRIRELES